MTRTRPRRAQSVLSSAVSSTIPSAATSAAPSRAPSPGPRKSFRFFDLPAELRLRVYEQVLGLQDPIDLDPLNYRRILPRLSLFLVSRRMHEEAYRVFFSQPVRLFPDHGRFFNTKKPLLMRLPTRYREAISTMQLRLGKGWSKPPRCQSLHPRLGLTECINLKTLKVLVELDPSDSVFMGFRGANATEDTYKWFCIDLLQGIFEQVPSLETVEIDAFPGVKKDSPLVLALKHKVDEFGKKLVWGPLRGFGNEDWADSGLLGLESGMQALAIPSRVVQVTA